VFQTGALVLTCHHIGSPPLAARVKWLYHNQKLFARQTAELREAGFSTPEFETILEASRPNPVDASSAHADATLRVADAAQFDAQAVDSG
jgi:hypothetical protein